jgi:hypothetical protein
MSTVLRIEQPQLQATVVVSEFIMVCSGALKAFSSILISITINGIKSKKIISTVVKVDRRLLCDSSTTYRKALVFTLLQMVAVFSYVAVLFIYDIWVWTHAMKDMSVW